MKPGSLLRGAEQARSYMHVADLLRQKIQKMDVDAGGRLPSERELASLLNISRPSLREALIALELQGEIEIRVGSGIYLRRAASEQVPRPHSPAADTGEISAFTLGDSPKEVNQVRGFLESGVAAHAARFMSTKQLRLLKKSLIAMNTALSARHNANPKAFVDADRLFHVTLAAAADNELLMQAVEDLFDQRYLPVAETMHRLFDDPKAWHAAAQEHQDIYDAVAAKDPLQAQAAMQRHLSRAHARLMAMIG